MTAPEILDAFQHWWCWEAKRGERWVGVYPVYVGDGLNGQWYIREPHPSTRAWRAEEDGTFTPLGAAAREEEMKRWVEENQEVLKKLAQK